MPPTLQPAASSPPAATGSDPASLLLLECFTYDERHDVLPTLARALDVCGCFVLDRQTLSATQIEVRFEMQLHAALDLYSSLIAAGLELTRGSHQALTGLCTVRKHRRRNAEAARVMEIRLQMSFLEELDLASTLLPGAARA